MKTTLFAPHCVSHADKTVANPAAIFRSAVLAELGNVYPDPVAWPGNIDVFLHHRYPALRAAVENFRPFVPWWKRWLFDRAWFDYYTITGKKDDLQCYHQYMAFDTANDPKKTFHGKVSRLLAFAKES
jgi:hypothetical protein